LVIGIGNWQHFHIGNICLVPDRSLAVVVGVAGAAYRRPDGVYGLPLAALRPK